MMWTLSECAARVGGLVEGADVVEIDVQLTRDGERLQQAVSTGLGHIASTAADEIDWLIVRAIMDLLGGMVVAINSVL